jgi:hypothetical protein
MFVLNNLTQVGYLQIKKDKEELLKKIQQYQTLVDEFDLALPFLEAIYEPKITIEFNEKISFYVAKTSIPFNGKNLLISEKLGGKIEFSGENDPTLIERAERKIKSKIRKQFPLHFEE